MHRLEREEEGGAEREEGGAEREGGRGNIEEREREGGGDNSWSQMVVVCPT